MGGSSLPYVTTCVKVDLFLICHVNICLNAYVTIWVETFYSKVAPSHVGGYWLCASGNMKHLICHVTSPNHTNEGSCNVMSGNSSLFLVEI